MYDVKDVYVIKTMYGYTRQHLSITQLNRRPARPKKRAPKYS